jgi:ribosomal protein S12 methylthiotransferase accessory factor YcaO
MHRLSSSLRRRSAEETLRIIANDIAPQLGITRVTDTTWLDRIGIICQYSARRIEGLAVRKCGKRAKIGRSQDRCIHGGYRVRPCTI